MKNAKKYVILYSTKGGVGKTTFAKLTHMVLAILQGYKVEGEDLDPQQHYADFLAKHPGLISTPGESEYFIYDTQGAHTKANEELLEAAKTVESLIIVPVRPSGEDLKEARRIAARLEKLGLIHKVAFVLNGCHHAKDYSVYVRELKKLGTVARKRINSRAAFAENPAQRELNDFSQLLHEVLL